MKNWFHSLIPNIKIEIFVNKIEIFLYEIVKISKVTTFVITKLEEI